ncbi:bestrophin family protein [Entomomonas asaccharolytica]|uniref:Bestrophin n=1 Tax=Entomomonas asaccharolytica TaxID=2785331 RepID=A0A974NHE5_9GAMM|nr:bestrophin family ion channel [Entomomonas asaccharolytica]QQP86514.1 bestrophin [Entomomonas asaccharolytica]
MIVKSKTPSTFALLFTKKGSIIPIIWRRVLFTVLLSSLVVLSHGTLYHYKIIITAAPFTIWGITLAIFLSFRNNVAYQRFWEARTLWGQLLISGRNLTRQLVSFFPQLSKEEQQAITNKIIAFGYALRNTLRDNAPLQDLEPYLTKQEYQELENSPNIPNKLLSKLGIAFANTCHKTNTNAVLLSSIDRELSHLSGVLSGCEKIKNTPLPFPYILLLHRTVHIYCFVLPFCLVDSIGWSTPFAVCFLAYTFFGLDALGDQISDPFDAQQNDLPLDAMSRNLEINVKEIIGQELPEPIQPVDDVLM